MIKVVMFDFDGTIADSFGVILEAFEKLVPQDHKVTKQEVRSLRNKPYSEILHHFNISILKVPGLVIRGRQMIKKNISNVEPFDGMAEAVRQLKQAGYHLAILSSNSSQNIIEFLEKHHLSGYFDSVRGSVGLLGKPKVIRAMMKKLRCSANEVAYIGDEPRDVDAAHKVGVHSVAVTWGFISEKVLSTHQPEVIVNHPLELPEKIANL